MTIPIFQVDAFAEKPFEGNPAAICVLSKAMPEGWMQSVAAEMNFSETAFLRSHEDGYALRWFTPTMEVDICGHATLASAHTLWTEGFVKRSKPIQFHTRSGVLTCTETGDLIELDFPALPVTEEAPLMPLVDALGVQPAFFGRTRFDKFVVVESEEILRRMAPDFIAMLRQPNIRGVMVSSPSSDPRFDFVSRFFAPAAGVNEDPVTGSAHCSLAPFWSQRLGKLSMIGFQASRRGGVVHVKFSGDRVILGGRAATVLRGELVAE